MRGVDAIMAARRAESFTKRSIKAASKRQALRCAMSMLDLTTLEGKDTPGKVRALCRKAVQPLDVPAGAKAPDFPVPHVAAVCVYPMLVPVACEALAGSGVHVAAVATGFPSAQYPLDVRLRDCADYPLALPDPSYGGRQLLDEATARSSFRFEAVVESNSFEFLRNYVRFEQAITFQIEVGAPATLKERHGLVSRPVDLRDMQPARLAMGQLRGRALPVAAAKFAEQLGRRFTGPPVTSISEP
jgi:hypothetical protein